MCSSDLNNTGTLAADSSVLTVTGAVTGAGTVRIAAGTADFTSTFAENVSFVGTTGALELAHSLTYTGQITGFSKTGTTTLDLGDISFISGTTKATYSGTTTSGVLTVTDGSHTAKITLEGNYTTSTFTVSAATGGGTAVVDPTPPTSGHQVNPMPLLPFVAAMASLGAERGGSVTTTSEAWRGSQAALAAPGGRVA